MDSVAVATFWFSSVLIIPLWIMMWFMPRSDITKKIVGDLRFSVIPLILSYAILLAPNVLDVLITLGSKMPTPDIVLDLFSTDEMIILAWLHFLVMDTFAGRYVWMRMIAADKPIQFSMPILLVCMMLGPIGLLIGILTTLDVDDINITIAKGAANSAAADGAGITVDGAGATLIYDDTGTQWEFNKPLEVTGTLAVSSTATITGGFTNTTFDGGTY